MRTHAEFVELAAIALMECRGSRVSALVRLRRDCDFSLYEGLRALGAVDRSNFAAELAAAGVEPFGLENYL